MPGRVPPPSPIRGCKSRCKSSILGRSGGRVPRLAGGGQWGGRVERPRCGTLAPALRAPPVGVDAGGWRLPRPQGPRRRPGGPEPLGVSPRARPARAAAGASGGGCPGVGSGRPWLSRVQVGGVVGVHLVVGALVQSVNLPSRPGEPVVRLRGARFPADWGSRPGPREAGVQLGASKRGRGAGRMPQPGSDVHAANYEPWLALGRSRSGGGGGPGPERARVAARGEVRGDGEDVNEPVVRLLPYVHSDDPRRPTVRAHSSACVCSGGAGPRACRVRHAVVGVLEGT